MWRALLAFIVDPSRQENHLSLGHGVRQRAEWNVWGGFLNGILLQFDPQSGGLFEPGDDFQQLSTGPSRPSGATTLFSSASSGFGLQRSRHSCISSLRPV